MKKSHQIRFLPVVLAAFIAAFFPLICRLGSCEGAVIDGCEKWSSDWSVFKSSSVEISHSADSTYVKEGTFARKIDFKFDNKEKPFIAFLVKDLGTAWNMSGSSGLSLWVYIPEASSSLAGLSVMAYQEDGTAYIAQNVGSLKTVGWQKVVAPFSSFVFSSGGLFKSKSDPLDIKEVRKVAIGIYQPSAFTDSSFILYVDDIENESSLVRTASVLEPASNLRISTLTSPVVDDFSTTSLQGWSKNIAPNVNLECAIDGSVLHDGMKSMRMQYDFSSKDPFWGFYIKDLGQARNWKDYDSLRLWTYVPTAAEDLTEFSLMIYEEDGSAYIAQQVRNLKTSGWVEVVAPFKKFYLAGSWTSDENDQLDFDQIRKVAIGIFQPSGFSDSSFALNVVDIRAVKASESASSGGESSATSGAVTGIQKFEPADGKVIHGVFAFSAPLSGWGNSTSDWEKQFDEQQLTEYESLAGKTTDAMSFVWFLDWDFPLDMCNKINGIGKIPVISVTAGAFKPTDIVAGKADAQLSAWAAGAKSFGKPIFLRFFPEMNGNWNIYSESYDPTQTHESYVAAWKHAHDVFTQAGVENVAWVWAPTAVDVGPTHWTSYYPGDDYVDWAGISVYPILGSGDPETLIMDFYNDYASRKPIMIAECGAGDADDNFNAYNPGDKYSDNPEKWIGRFFDTLENKAPRVKAFLWFNISRERDWRIQESSTKAAVYRERLSNGRYGLNASGQ